MLWLRPPVSIAAHLRELWCGESVTAELCGAKGTFDSKPHSKQVAPCLPVRQGLETAARVAAFEGPSLSLGV